MDYFTDMMRAFVNGTIDIPDLYLWYNEFSKLMRPDVICRAAEIGTQMCANAMEMLIRLSW